MSSTVTKNISRYVKDKGISLSHMSKVTGISYMVLYDSLLNPNRDRELRAGELMDICEFLGINPEDFNREEVKQENGPMV